MCSLRGTNCIELRAGDVPFITTSISLDGHTVSPVKSELGWKWPELGTGHSHIMKKWGFSVTLPKVLNWVYVFHAARRSILYAHTKLIAFNFRQDVSSNVPFLFQQNFCNFFYLIFRIIILYYLCAGARGVQPISEQSQEREAEYIG